MFGTFRHIAWSLLSPASPHAFLDQADDPGKQQRPAHAGEKVKNQESGAAFVVPVVEGIGIETFRIKSCQELPADAPLVQGPQQKVEQEESAKMKCHDVFRITSDERDQPASFADRIQQTADAKPQQNAGDARCEV